jgi:pyruvate,orthophosphate dikinase
MSIDGTTGEVFVGQIKTIPSEILRVLVDKTLKPAKSQIYQDFALLMKWADETRRLGIRTNAINPIMRLLPWPSARKVSAVQNGTYVL